MLVPLEITFRGLDPSETIETEIREQVEKLQKFCDRIVSCHVAFEVPHRHHRHGNLFEVRIFIVVPGRDLAVARKSSVDWTHTDSHVTIRDAFKAMRRELEDYQREIRGHVKAHVLSSYGKVEELFPLANYGFLETQEGRRIYFHRNAVLNNRFNQLEPGSKVCFVEEEGDKGPQASTVELAGRQHTTTE